MTTVARVQSPQVIVEQKIAPITPRRLDPDRVADLRRRVDRGVADLLVSRAAWVRPEERALVVAVFRDGAGLPDLARIAGCAGKTARERLKRTVTRMLSDRFAFVLRERQQLGPARWRIATECVLHGRSMREAARSLGVSLHTVRRHMEFISAMESARHAERAA